MNTLTQEQQFNRLAEKIEIKCRFSETPTMVKDSQSLWVFKNDKWRLVFDGPTYFSSAPQKLFYQEIAGNIN